MLRVGCGYSPSAKHVISTPSLSSIVFFVYIRSNFFSVAGTNELLIYLIQDFLKNKISIFIIFKVSISTYNEKHLFLMEKKINLKPITIFHYKKTFKVLKLLFFLPEHIFNTNLTINTLHYSIPFKRNITLNKQILPYSFIFSTIDIQIKGMHKHKKKKRERRKKAKEEKNCTTTLIRNWTITFYSLL